MPRFAFQIEYDGAPFVGWQRQPNQTSVQGAIETALRVLEPGFETIAGAGRTDAGVHAWGQVAHANLSRNWSPFKLMQAVNQHLKPAPITILRTIKVADDWHARFSAIERQYLYRIIQRRAPLGLDRGKVWKVKFPLNIDAMQDGAAHLIGHHDFTTYRSKICQAKSPVKTLDEIAITASEYPAGREIRISIRARSFLHNQVRSIVGTLAKVGGETWKPAAVRDALQAKDRAACGPVAPPDGLYLMAVKYPVDPFA